MSSVTINTQDFANPNFNPKQWINSVLKTPTADNEDEDAKNTTVIVTKLEIASETTSRQFDQLSNQVLQSMPRILYDLKVISDNARCTHEHVKEVRKSLGSVEDQTEAVIDNLRRPHIAKERMEECRSILLEKSDHLNKMREEKERLQAEEEAAKAKAEEAAEKEMRRLEAKAQEEEKERERVLAEQQELLKEQERKKQEEEKKKAVDKESQQQQEEEEEEDDDDYGHVQLPPLRQPEPKTRITTMQQLNQPIEENNNGYLQQVTPQVSSVFKRIGVPVSPYLSCLNFLTFIFV